MKLNPMSKPPTTDRIVLLVFNMTDMITARYMDMAGGWRTLTLIGQWGISSKKLPEHVTPLGWIECPEVDIEEQGA